MPFTKVGKDDYTSPSGRHFNTAQVRLWHANGNKFPGQKTAEYAEGGIVNKGYSSSVQSFAKGGPVLGKESAFLKTEDDFRGKPNPPVVKTDETFGKGSSHANAAPAAKGKGLPLPK